MKFFTCILLLLPLFSFAQNAKDTLYANSINVLTKSKEEKGMLCFLMYEGEEQKATHESMASFIDLGKKFVTIPPKAGNLWIFFGENDSMFVSRKEYTVLDIPNPKIALSVNGTLAAKSSTKVYRGQKVKINLSMPKAMNISDKRYRMSEVKLAYFKDFSQSAPTKVEDLTPTGSGTCLELNTQNLNLHGFSQIKLQIGKLYRVGYNNKEYEVEMSRAELTFSIQIKDDTIAKKPVVAPKTPVKTAVAPIITHDDILYFTDGTNALPLPDVRVIADREPIILNVDSVMKNVNIAVLQKNLGGDNNIKVKILVDEKGHYADHLILKESNPVTTSRACAFMPYLRFLPAVRAGKNIKYWITLPITFR